MRTWELGCTPCSGHGGDPRGEKRIAVIPHGKSLGGMPFFLSSPRVATAVKLDDVDLVTIMSDNICILMNEFLKEGVEMLRDTAIRQWKMQRLIDS